MYFQYYWHFLPRRIPQVLTYKRFRLILGSCFHQRTFPPSNRFSASEKKKEKKAIISSHSVRWIWVMEKNRRNDFPIFFACFILAVSYLAIVISENNIFPMDKRWAFFIQSKNYRQVAAARLINAYVAFHCFLRSLNE